MMRQKEAVTTEKKIISDDFGRSFRTLRISLTDICNLACLYCVSEGDNNKPSDFACSENKKLLLSDYIGIVKKINELTILETIRLTGGEPLLFKDILPLVKDLKALGIPKVKITTNAFFLKEIAKDLKAAGIDSINVSLDALDEKVFYKMSRRKNVTKVIEGIEEAIKAGIGVKLNCVVMKGVNEDQVLPLLSFAAERNITIRYLELMSMGHMFSEHSKFYFPEKEILSLIGNKYNYILLNREKSATANYWITDDLKKFGIISNISRPFCGDCNRLRLDSYGNIFGCLSNNKGIHILDCMNDEKEMEIRLRKALGQKQTVFTGSPLSMKSIGG